MRLRRVLIRWTQVNRPFVDLRARCASAAVGVTLMLAALVLTLPRLSVAQQVTAETESKSPVSDPAPATQIEHWIGALRIGDIKLNLRLDVRREEGGALSAKLFSVDQGNAEIPVDSISLSDGKLAFACPKIQAEFAGTLNDAGNTAAGTFKQFGNKFDLELRRVVNLEAELPDRPQMPKPPFTYTSEDVSFENTTAGVTLSGTLTIPAKGEKFPAVVLVTGSGPQDRDETLMNHKPFLVIADHLSRNGIAVLRYDDRGVGKSSGDFASSTTEDFAQDAAAALEFLAARSDIDTKRIGLIGHSEGAIIASMLAANDRRLAHVVLLAGTGVPGSEVIISQAQAIVDKSGQVDPHVELRKQIIELVLRDAPREEIDKTLDDFLGAASDEPSTAEAEQTAASPSASQQAQKSENGDAAEQQGRMLRMAFRQLDTAWFRFFLKHDPRVDLRKAACPVLALNGANDLQVLPDLNLPEVEKALAESPIKGHRCEKLAKLNHLFQESETGLPQEYGTLTQTISPEVLKSMTGWIKSH